METLIHFPLRDGSTDVTYNISVWDALFDSCQEDNTSWSKDNKPTHHKHNTSICRGDVTSSVSTLGNSSEGQLEDQYEFKIAQWIWQIGPVILFFFSTCGNVAILLTLRHLRLGRTSMHIYLRALAVSDLAVIFTGLLRNWIKWTFELEIRTQHVVVCKLHTWLVYVSLSVSTWLLVLMTLERAISTCMPHRVASYCTSRRAIYIIVVLILFQVVLHSHMLFGLSLTYDTKSASPQCNNITSNYGFFLHNVYPLLDLATLSLLPFLCLTIGNTIIVWKTFVSIKTVEGMIKSTTRNNSKRRRKRASTMTIILLSLSGLFLVTTFPVCVFNLWERGGSFKEYNKTVKLRARVELFWAIVNVAMYSNNTFNFYLYCLTGKKFRFEMFRRLTRNRSESQSNNMSGALVHRCVLINEANRKQETYRELTPLRVSSFRVTSPGQEV